jgi:pimeloyl-ACP methyl ester carboxylesterase
VYVSHSSKLPLIQRGYTKCRYGQMHYRQAGPGGANAATLVLLHQNPSSSYEYEALIAAMAVDRRVIAFDTPGYGMSDPPPSPPGMAGYAAAFGDALDEMGLNDPVDLYGYHTGTLLSIELAIQRPELVRRIALTGIPMYPPEALAARLKEAEDYPAPDEKGKVILTLLNNLWTYVVSNRDPAVSFEKAVLNFADKARVLNRFTWAYRGVWAWDFSRLALMKHEALLLQPAEDLLEASLAGASLLPNVTVCHLPDLDRDIFDIAPERIASELRTFFQ